VAMTVKTPSGGAMPAAIAVTTTQTQAQLVSINISAANSVTRGQAYWIDWSWLTAGVDYKRRQYFDIVRSTLYPVVSDQDLGQFIPNYKAYLPQDKNGIVLQADWQLQSDVAFRRIQRRLLTNGYRSHLVLDSEDLREVHELLFASIVAEYIFTRTPDDNWMKLAKTWRDEYDTQWENLPLRYDFGDSGTLQGAELHQRAKTRTRLVRGHQRP